MDVTRLRALSCQQGGGGVWGSSSKQKFGRLQGASGTGDGMVGRAELHCYRYIGTSVFTPQLAFNTAKRVTKGLRDLVHE